MSQMIDYILYVTGDRLYATDYILYKLHVTDDR